MNELQAKALIAASKFVRKTLAPLWKLDELTPELIQELYKLQREIKEWSFQR